MKKTLLAALMSFAVAVPAYAQIKIDDPWVRATVPAQKATGAFMQLTASTDARLVSAQSPVANIVEVHEMVMEGDVMKMRALEAGLALPAGQTVALKPGGYHVMLIDLKGQLKEGDKVPLILVVEGKEGKRESLAIEAPVRPLNQPHRGHMQ